MSQEASLVLQMLTWKEARSSGPTPLAAAQAYVPVSCLPTFFKRRLSVDDEAVLMLCHPEPWTVIASEAADQLTPATHTQ